MQNRAAGASKNFMGYVVNRRGIQRTGFREFGRTDPFAAAQLSGLGRTPFDPEILRETLGQHHPFTADGGWGLHGLGDIVPNGSLVTYTGQWVTDISTTPDQMLAKVAAALSRDGLHVVSSSQSGGFLGIMFSGSFTATLQIQVSNGMGYANPSDIASVVDHEFFAASGEMPTGSSVSVQSIPGATPGINLPGTSTDLLGWLEQNAMWIGLGLLGMVIVPDLLKKL